MQKSQKKIIIYILLTAIFLCLSLFLVGFINYKKLKLSEFLVYEVIEENDKQYIIFEKSKNAEEYKIVIVDADENILYTVVVKDNKCILPNLDLNYKEQIYIKVSAVNKKGDIKDAKNLLSYEHNYASFSRDNSYYIVDAKPKTLLMDGNLNNNYYLKLFYQDEIIHSQNLNENNISIEHDVIEPYIGKITAKLYHKELLVNAINLYHDATIVSDIRITNLESNTSTTWNDLEIKYEGGNNATSYGVNIFIGKKFIGYVEGNKDRTVIPASMFKENTNYTFEVVAMYEDYKEIAKKNHVNIFISEKLMTDPVFVNYNPETIKKDTLVTLNTKTENAQIYYTTDGSDPKTYGKLYSSAIKIDKDMVIKALAVRQNYLDSEVNTYNFQIRTKNLVIYLSPSNQYGNMGVRSVGYTNEQEMMNKVADIVQKRLMEAGVSVYRNTNLRDGMMLWMEKSRAVGADLHFAIHSNGSTKHDTKGIEIYVHEPTSKALSIANALYDNLYSIYPYQSQETNRGVKFARGALGEVNPVNVKVGTLIEIAYHDDFDDAKWMVQNLEKIGNNLANSILEFYQIIEVGE